MTTMAGVGGCAFGNGSGLRMKRHPMDDILACHYLVKKKPLWWFV
jgi:hypothetical protein